MLKMSFFWDFNKSSKYLISNRQPESGLTHLTKKSPESGLTHLTTNHLSQVSLSWPPTTWVRSHLPDQNSNCLFFVLKWSQVKIITILVTAFDFLQINFSIESRSSNFLDWKFAVFLEYWCGRGSSEGASYDE